MDNFLMLINGFQIVFTLNNLMACTIGAVLGLIIGAMPGIGSMSGVALLLPLTYAFNPTTAIIMLGALYYANMYGGAFSAILMNIPGESTAVMTAIDGYPMAMRGRPGQALLVSNISSFIGGTIGIVILTFLGPGLAQAGLRFGPAELTSLLLMAMASVGWLVGDNPIKGIMGTLLGILIATIGMDTMTGLPRYHFGNMYLLGGIPFIPFVIGVVGFAQVITIMESRMSASSQTIKGKLTFRNSMLSLEEFKQLLAPTIRCGFLGTFIGVLPGVGATAASFLGYASQKAFKNSRPLGTGAVEGIAAPESANNAAAAGAFAPLLALGIPGSGTGAVLLGGLIMWGLTPGPLLFTKSPDFAWGLIASLYVANVITLAISWGVIPHMIKILTVPIKLIIPMIVVVCFVGTYADTNSMFGVLVMLVAGVIGYVMDKYKYPVAPMLLAYVLAPRLEDNMRKAFITSGGSPSIFFTRPISLAFMLVFLGLLLFPIVKAIVNGIKARSRKGSQAE